MERTVLCIAGALFGRPFLLEAKRLGWRVFLMTEEKYLREDWPRDQIDEIFAVPDLYDERVVRNVVTYLARTTRFDRIVGLGEFDIEVAAALREHTRIGGMGETTARYFRDKLAMRMKARDEGALSCAWQVYRGSS
ncbi:MAG: ATPase, partial [Chlorobiota bacterium]